MRNILLFATLLALTLSCVSQKPKTNNNMETERLTYFSFDHHNSMAQSGEKYEVRLMKDGRIHVVIDEGFPGEKEFYLADSAILDELQALVRTYKMDKYKSSYESKWRVFDGDSWSLYYKYDSKRSVSSGGYEAWPDNYGEMRQALSAYFQKWRDYQQGVMLFDYFRITCKNSQGRDQEFSLERGDSEATLTLRDAQRGIDKTLKVSNEYLHQLQQTANSVRMKSDLYDYHTTDPEATQCTYFVHYSTGDTLSGYTGFTQYAGHKESALLGFFDQWLGGEE